MSIRACQTLARVLHTRASVDKPFGEVPVLSVDSSKKHMPSKLMFRFQLC